MADRLSVDNYINDNVVPRVDACDYMHLGKSAEGDRIDLFMYAAALGYSMGKRTPIKSKHGFILNVHIPDHYRSLIWSVFIHECIEAKSEVVNDFDQAEFVIQEYANTGFYEIENRLNQFKNGINENEDLWDCLREANSLYQNMCESE
jgi:hypothetical protein